jgi:excinuclease ABC subunit C
MKDEIRQQITGLPDAPGIYRFYNSDGILIYVGKAKNIKKRVSSYFVKSHDSLKTAKLVSEIKKIEYTITNSEFDALLLENNFIKQNQPKYNILLKDDKTFPYLAILNERFPRIISTRKFIPDSGEYFGPYTSVVSMKSVLDLIRQLYSIRTCSLLLSPENIESRKFKVCLEYHIGNCKGPCENLQTEASYLEEITLARNILKGQLSVVENYFKQRMQEAAHEMQFERAELFKNKLTLLEKFQTKSLVVNRKITDIDVITITSDEQDAFVNYMQIKEGGIIFSKNLEIKKKLDETDSELLSYAYQEIQPAMIEKNQTIFSNIPISTLPEGIDNQVPVIGDKKHIVSLSLKNALYIRSKKESEKEEKKAKKNEVLDILQKDLRLQQTPQIIECFDNSNFQGTTPVASMVRFVAGKPDKAGYRHFNIKTVEGANDFASMKEIVSRRYTRLLEENKPLPNLIIVDGGKGQLSSACEALQELELYGRIPIVGIAKKLEEIYYPNDPVPLHINKKSPGLFLIQRIRDEAHRFAITFHRQKRSKASFNTEIESIEGIGKKTADVLLATFKSWKKIKEVPESELAKIIGAKKAKQVLGK